MSTKLHCNITDKTREILDILSEVDELSITDIVNRSIQLYDFVRREQDSGNRLALKLVDGTFSLVHLA
jgi:hypothetical protein